MDASTPSWEDVKAIINSHANSPGTDYNIISLDEGWRGRSLRFREKNGSSCGAKTSDGVRPRKYVCLDTSSVCMSGRG